MKHDELKKELGMRRMRLSNVGQSATALMLVMACSGQTQNLGHDNVVTTGGSPGETGGVPTTGGSQGDTGGTSSSSAYVLNPTLPIDPSCTCATSDMICNAARECVPRCDEQGRCARWLADRGVVDLFVEASTLFYILGPSTDPLGNPATNGSLYRVDTNGGSPTLVSANLGSPSKILGRHNAITYVKTNSAWNSGTIISVTDSGAVTVLGDWGTGSYVYANTFASMRNHWIAWVNPDASALMGIDLDADLQPVVLAQPPPENSGSPAVSMPMVLDDVVVYEIRDKDTNNPQMCSLQLANLAGGASCEPFLEATYVLASSNQYYAWPISAAFVDSYAPPAARRLRLLNENDAYIIKVVYANGWLYIHLFDAFTPNNANLVRAPATVGRYPQQVLPEELVTRHSRYGESSLSSISYAVGATELFWVQPYAKGANYIFAAPLPPQPCDAELPCADVSLACNNGLCSPA